MSGLLATPVAFSESEPAVSNPGNETMSEIHDPSEPGGAPAGAVPPLEYQIKEAQSIVLCATIIEGETVSCHVRGIWKDQDSRFKTGATLRLDTGLHELLGYHPAAGQEVLLFFTATGLPADQPLEVLPVVNGGITYSPHDLSVQEILTLDQVRKRVTGAGMVIPLKVSFIGVKSVPWLALGHNNLAPVLALFHDHLEQKVIIRKTKNYSDIAYVDVSVTDTDNLDIAYTGSPLTFSCKPESRQDLITALRFFNAQGIRLGDKAKRLLGENKKQVAAGTAR